MEQFELIRRDHFIGGMSIRELARRHHVHRRAVRQAVRSAVPPPRRVPDREPTVLTRQLRGLIEEWLVADRDAPRKQRHTAVTIYQRLCDSHGFTGAASTASTLPTPSGRPTSKGNSDWETAGFATH